MSLDMLFGTPKPRLRRLTADWRQDSYETKQLLLVLCVFTTPIDIGGDDILALVDPEAFC